MITYIPRTKTNTKANSPTCTVREYLFNQPSVDIAQVTIEGRYPINQNKKAVNLICDLIYFALEGKCTVNTAQGTYKLNPQDALFIPHGSWYWVEASSVKILIASAPAWNAKQYKEI